MLLRRENLLRIECFRLWFICSHFSMIWIQFVFNYFRRDFFFSFCKETLFDIGLIGSVRNSPVLKWVLCLAAGCQISSLFQSPLLLRRLPRYARTVYSTIGLRSIRRFRLGKWAIVCWPIHVCSDVSIAWYTHTDNNVGLFTLLNYTCICA